MSDTIQTGDFWDTVVRNFAENAGVLEPSLLRSLVERLRAALHEEGVDLTRQRQHLTPEEVTSVNKVLCTVNLQLVERDAGMELTGTPYMRDPSTSDETLVNAGFLFCWLLSTNLDVRSVCLEGTLLLTRLPSVIKVGLSSNATVRKITVCVWDDDSEKHGSCLAEGLHPQLPLEVYFNRGLELTEQSAALIAETFKGCCATLKEVHMTNGPQRRPNQKNILLLLEALTESCKLTTLHLYGYGLGRKGGEILARILGTCSTLKKLSIQEATDKALDAVVEGLQGSVSLEILDMSSSYRSSGRLAMPLAEFMKRNGSIKSIKLMCMNISDHGAKALANMLTENRTLKKLSLAGNRIGDNGAFALADAIRGNNTLEKLDLSGNNISGDALRALMEALRANKSVKRLCIDGVVRPLPDVVSCMEFTMDNIGLQELARALQNGADIEKLNVRWDSGCNSFYVGQLFSAIGSNDSVIHLHIGSADYIDVYAAGQLAHAFSSTTRLKSVSFAYEFEDPDVVMTLLNGLSRNKSIRDVNFGCTFFYSPVPEVLKDLFVTNSTLRSLRINDVCLRGKKMVPILEGLAQNYTLTSLDLGCLDDPGYELFQVQELVRRNQRILRCAVQFVAGKLQTDEAREAYRKLSSTVSLVEKVMELQGLPRDAAEELVQAAGVSA